MAQIIDKQAVAESFSKAAVHYDQFAQLQRDIGEQLLNNVTLKAPINVVDLGCGTGYFSEKITQIRHVDQLVFLGIGRVKLVKNIDGIATGDAALALFFRFGNNFAAPFGS